MAIPVSQTAAEIQVIESHRTFWLEVLLLVTITAIAVFLRYHKIGEVPPGLNSDEAVGAVGALETLRSGPQLYYEGQGGGGSLGFYIAAVGFALFGPSIATIRGTAAFVGVIGVVAAYLATREMFRKSTGLNRARILAALTALGLATSLWHTQSSRVAFAAIAVPFLQLPGNYFLWRGLNTGRRIHFIISGFFLASLMYIYLSGSFAPFVYLLFFLIQWLVTIVQSHLPQRDSRDAPPPLIKRHFWNLAICAGVAFALFLPMLYFYVTAPDLATERAQQALFTNPRINQGDPWVTLGRSIWGNLAAFGLSPSWVQGQPPANLILPTPMSLLFVLGLAISLWRVAQPPYLFVLVYWGVMLVPSILTPDAIPHPLRAVGAAPAVYTLAAIGVMGIVDFGIRAVNWVSHLMGDASRASTVRPQPGGGMRLFTLAAVLLGLGLLVGRPTYQSFRHYFVEWPKTYEAKAGFHVYAVKLAKEMSKETDPQATFLLPRNTAAGDVNPNYTVMFLYTGEAGYTWLVDDENTLETAMNEALQERDIVHVVRWKTSKHTLADPKDVIPYYLEKHGTFVEKRSYEYFDIETYRLDRTGPDLTDGALVPASIDFGGWLELTGVAYGDASGTKVPETPSVPAGDMLWVRLRLRSTAPIEKELKASVILNDSAGHVVGQIDKLLLNNFLHQDSEDWEPGTEVDAYFLIPVDPASAPGDYRLGLAIYDADSFDRLPSPSADAAQVVTLGRVRVRPDLSPPPIEALEVSVALDQPIADELTLLGLASAVGDILRPGERASLALLWRADAVPSNDYRASLWLTQGDDAWPLTESLPLAGLDYPSSHWEAGQVVRGWLDGQVRTALDSGDYALEVHVADTTGAPKAEVPLGTVRIQGWPRQFETPPMQHNLGAKFSDHTELLGYDVEIAHSKGDQDQETVVVTLYWRALSEMDANYATFVHLLNEAGQVVAQVDHIPGDGAYPTTGWLSGEIIVDEFVVPLPEVGTSTFLQLEIGIYDTATGERLLVVDPSQMGDHVLLPDRIPAGP
jgi:hypothetical protein